MLIEMAFVWNLWRNLFSSSHKNPVGIYHLAHQSASIKICPRLMRRERYYGPDQAVQLCPNKSYI